VVVADEALRKFQMDYFQFVADEVQLEWSRCHLVEAEILLGLLVGLLLELLQDQEVE
jgi:hypothetical protein